MQGDDGREIRDLRTSMVDSPVRGEQSPLLLCNSRLRAADCRAGMGSWYNHRRAPASCLRSREILRLALVLALLSWPVPCFESLSDDSPVQIRRVA
jgi:hypothetical protein